MSSKDYYAILEINKEATLDEIKSSYRKLAKQYHPDVNKSSEAEERFKAIAEAYAILSDPEKRVRYDNGETDNWSRNINFDDFIRNFFDFREGPRNTKPVYEQVLALTLAESILGFKKQIEIEKKVICSSCKGTRAEPGTQPNNCTQCNGSGMKTVEKIVPGGKAIFSSTCFHCNGQGSTIEKYCTKCNGKGKEKIKETVEIEVPAGKNIFNGANIQIDKPDYKLYLIIRIPVDDFVRDPNNNLLAIINLPWTNLLLGDTIKVNNIREEINVTIPPNSKPGDKIVIEGQGATNRGSLVILLKAIWPENIDEHLAAKLKEIQNINNYKEGTYKFEKFEPERL